MDLGDKLGRDTDRGRLVKSADHTQARCVGRSMRWQPNHDVLTLHTPASVSGSRLLCSCRSFLSFPAVIDDTSTTTRHCTSAVLFQRLFNLENEVYLEGFNCNKWHPKRVKIARFFCFWFSVISQKHRVMIKDFFASYLVYRHIQLNLPWGRRQFFYMFLSGFFFGEILTNSEFAFQIDENLVFFEFLVAKFWFVFGQILS